MTAEVPSAPVPMPAEAESTTRDAARHRRGAAAEEEVAALDVLVPAVQAGPLSSYCSWHSVLPVTPSEDRGAPEETFDEPLCMRRGGNPQLPIPIRAGSGITLTARAKGRQPTTTPQSRTSDGPSRKSRHARPGPPDVRRPRTRRRRGAVGPAAVLVLDVAAGRERIGRLRNSMNAIGPAFTRTALWVHHVGEPLRGHPIGYVPDARVPQGQVLGNGSPAPSAWRTGTPT